MLESNQRLSELASCFAQKPMVINGKFCKLQVNRGGDRIVTTDSDSTKLWNGKDGSLITTLKRKLLTPAATDFATTHVTVMSADKIIMVEGNTIKIYDAQDCSLVKQIEDTWSPMVYWCAQINSQGTRLALGSSTGATLWNISEDTIEQPLIAILEDEHDVYSTQFNNTGDRLLISTFTLKNLFNVIDGSLITALLPSAHFNVTDNTIAAMHHPNRLMILNATNGSFIRGIRNCCRRHH